MLSLLVVVLGYGTVAKRLTLGRCQTVHGEDAAEQDKVLQDESWRVKDTESGCRAELGLHACADERVLAVVCAYLLSLIGYVLACAWLEACNGADRRCPLVT